MHCILIKLVSGETIIASAITKRAIDVFVITGPIFRVGPDGDLKGWINGLSGEYNTIPEIRLDTTAVMIVIDDPVMISDHLIQTYTRLVQIEKTLMTDVLETDQVE